MFVLDCSATMSWCFEDEHIKATDLLILLKTMPALVPSIWELEIMNVLLVAQKNKRIKSEAAQQFLELLSSLPIERDLGKGVLFNLEILNIAKEYKLSAYDAAYLELALRYNIHLASFDKKLCVAAHAAGIKLVV